ncbi:serine hydrolase domain-containing protein [Saccharibacillus sp. CPCC 101409]|uniref:serine hydrolase domain-containing protein n=1 Tax=Saccharibacillus sp. CPCC 101409 TaxID=3058041 RepID=UPI0026740FF5|nr:serine hydrolase domain-containing protein [Saccharibacillus sp. CPCC 101409]MDO3411277.1 serine hydrolase domain-containing protein [Saccharibacillus sp. CPCC 101409]
MNTIKGLKKTGAAAMAALLLALPVAEGQGTAWAAEASAATTTAAKEKDPVEGKAQEMIEALMSNYGVTGVQYAIRDKGKLVLSGGTTLDDAGQKQAISQNEMFGIGSVSKMYVTAAAMMLVDQGKVDIDRPLTDYIPEFQMADERYKQITPRMLMNHSAGLYGSHYKNTILMNDNDTQNHDTLLTNLRTEKLKSDPGEYSVYENDGFQLLELMVERVSGMSYTEYLERYVSAPLELTSTKTPLNRFDRELLEPVRFPLFEKAMPAENANILGTGGVYASAEELTKFSEVLTGEYPQILSEKSTQAMLQKEYRKGVWVKDEDNSFGFGLGWDAVNLEPFGEYGIQAVTKGGDTIMYHSALVALPKEDISIAVLSSGGSSIFNTTAASNILLEYLKQKGNIKEILPEDKFEKPVKKEMPAELNNYSGLYGNQGATREIAIENGEIKLPALMSDLIPAQTYVYTGDKEFTSEDGTTLLSFDDQTNGHTYIRIRSSMELPGLGRPLMAYYEYQKLGDNKLSADVTAAWKAREGKTYYALDEKINSFFYLSPSVLSKTITLDQDAEYANSTKIVDADHAVNAIEIPVMTGRDVFDLDFTHEGGAEYLQADGRTYIGEDGLAKLYAGHSSIVTIPASGDARWFKLPTSAAGKTLTVDAPQGAGFAVYDADGTPVNISTASGSNRAVLPEGGMIVFGGKAGDVVHVTLGQK